MKTNKVHILNTDFYYILIDIMHNPSNKVNDKPPFPDIEYLNTLDVFPFSENKYFEFKGNYQHFDGKINSVICSFLNAKGGYIICGIDDKTLEIKGIINSQKDIDNIILDIDNIYHTSRIIETNYMTFLDPDNILAEVIQHKNGKLIVITVTPTEGCKYQLHNGEVYVRLNASNLLIREPRLYVKNEVDSLIKRREGILIGNYTVSMKKLRNERTLYEEEADIYKYLLFEKIKAEKTNKEHELEYTNKTPTCSLFSIFCNIIWKS